MIHQPDQAFRYGSEAFWLVGFALEAGPVARAVDLGTGSGIMAMLLARHGVDVLGIDAHPAWQPFWERTLAEGGIAGRVELRTADVANAALPEVELVVCNPPFFAAGTGPVAPDPWRASARTESTATLADFVRRGLQALVPGGRLCLVLPIEREAEALRAAGELGGGGARQVRVGARRVLLDVRTGWSEPPVIETVEPRSERCSRWYGLAIAR